jgi:hypothetical protein
LARTAPGGDRAVVTATDVSTNWPAELPPSSVLDPSTLADSDVNAIVAINDKLGHRIVGAGIERQKDSSLPVGQPIE